jgi:hypothetical protein
MSGDISTYGGLKTALGEYSGRGSNATWAANRPLFVASAHSVLMRELDIPHLQETVDLTINAERIAIPTGYRAAKRLFLDGDWDSVVTPANQEQRVREAVSLPSGRPRIFSREGGYLAFGPVPDTSYVGKLLYKKAMTFFASDEATNSILTDHPMVYLYGARAEAARYDKFDEDEAKFEALFRATIAQINSAEQLATFDGGSLQMSPSSEVA